MQPITQMTNIDICFPNWFYATISIGVVGFLFYIGGFYIKLKEICKDHPKIREALTRISEILLQKNLAKEFIFTQSPIKLTAEGLAAVKEAQFEEFYITNRKILIERVKKANPTTMADVEEACKQIMLQMEDTLPGFEPIKQYAYQHGIPIAKILFACAITFRDKIAAEEPSLIQPSTTSP